MGLAARGAGAFDSAKGTPIASARSSLMPRPRTHLIPQGLRHVLVTLRGPDSLIAVLGRLVVCARDVEWQAMVEDDSVSKLRLELSIGFAIDGPQILAFRRAPASPTRTSPSGRRGCHPVPPGPAQGSSAPRLRPGTSFSGLNAAMFSSYALPAAVAAWYGRPNARCVSLMGDGSFGFALAELETAMRYKIPLLMIVFSNASFASIKASQRASYGKR